MPYGPAFGLGVRWAEEMGSRRQITRMDRLNMGYTLIYMNRRIKPVWYLYTHSRQHERKR